MSSQDSKKAKRRRIKKVGKNGQASTSVALQNQTPERSQCAQIEDVKEIEKFMDASYDCDSPVSLSRGPKPYLGGERCLLCRCERPDLPFTDNLSEDSDDKNRSEDLSTLPSLPLWVCPSCRKNVEKPLDSLIDQDFSSLPFLPEMNFGTPPADPTQVNSSVCTCEACTERRQIEAEHERETQELQKCWIELRKLVWLIYYHNMKTEKGDTGHLLDFSIPEEDRITKLVTRLCNRDPHQLFRRLESQAREFVLEKKVTLLQQLTEGHKTPDEAYSFVSKLLEEYAQLCKAASKLSGLLAELEKVHLKKFNVTWELHNKHLFQSIAYTDPLVQKSLPILIKQIRDFSSSKETCHEENYPWLLQRYHKFESEMTVVNVVWRDCQQLIEQYNEEQEALKVKQKMLKEDWEFFKEQRKLLEQKVLKKSSNQTTSSQFKCTAGLEAQFTETMRHLLQGTKPTPEECHCPTCNRKRCPCDECTITHMITCGIIHPDSVENNTNKTAQCVDEVTPPSMSSSTSSSGPASPLFVDSETFKHFENCQELRKESGDDDIEDDDCDEDEDDDDVSQSDDDDDDDDYDEDDEDDGSEEDGPSQNSDCQNPVNNIQPGLTIPQHGMWNPMEFLQNWDDPQMNQCPEGSTTAPTQNPTNCACFHCVSQAKAQQVAPEEGQCQCYVCLQQRGKMVSTNIPQQLPAAPRPELNLYPHIHGHSNHVRPLLQPQLYGLHEPIDIPCKVPLKLDFDTPEGLQEHMYHAYGEWDNTARMLIGNHKFGTEFLPSPPLPTPGPFIESLGIDGTGFTNSVIPQSVHLVSSTTSSANPTHNSISPTTAMSQPPAAQTESCQKATVRRTKHPMSQGQVNRILPPLSLMPPVSRPATMGGNSQHQVDDKTQRCHHSPSSQSKISTAQQQPPPPPNVMHGAFNPNGYQGHQNPQDGSWMSYTQRNDGKSGGGNNPIPPYSCSHPHSRKSLPSQPHPGMCPNDNNVSVGTSTRCTDPHCDSHHDDHYDSIDDSGSEQSSSTSTSNQKEGKYCDCCYCEFFGHSNPPSAPTSKNYPEMRDKLRLLLKRKKEAKQDDDIKPSNSLLPSKSDENHDPLEGKALDELVNFINGVDEPKDKQQTTKAAKRARQKQRKAQERARRNEEERQKLRKEVAKTCSQPFTYSPSSLHCIQTKFMNLCKEVLLPHDGNSLASVERTKKKTRVKPTVLRDEPAQSVVNREEKIFEDKPLTISRPEQAPREIKTATRSKASTQNNVIREKLPAKSPVPVKPNADDTSKSKLKDKTKAVSSPNGVPKAPGSPKPTSNKQGGKSSTPAPVQTSAPVNFTVNTPSVSNGTVQFTAQPDKTSFVSPNNIKRGNKKVSHIQQNNLNNLNGGIQSNITRNGLVIQPTNYQINSQRWTVMPDEQTKSKPVPNKIAPQQPAPQQPAPQPAQIINTLVKTPAKVESNGTKSAPLTNGHCIKPVVRGTDSAKQNNEQVQNKLQTGKNKKKNKKNKNSEDSKHIDEIFLPRSDSDLEGGELDDFEKELEEFKRFCFDSTPTPRQRLQVNVNLKDIFTKKKAGMGCS